MIRPADLFEIVAASDVGERPRVWCQSLYDAEVLLSGAGSLVTLRDLSTVQRPEIAKFAIVASVVGRLEICRTTPHVSGLDDLLAAAQLEIVTLRSTAASQATRPGIHPIKSALLLRARRKLQEAANDYACSSDVVEYALDQAAVDYAAAVSYCDGGPLPPAESTSRVVSVECAPAHAERLRAAWAEAQELLRAWQAIAADYQNQRNRAVGALDKISAAADTCSPTGTFAERVTEAIREHLDAVCAECPPAQAELLRTAWSKTRGLLASWESIVDDTRTLYKRADDALDNISTAVDQFRPDVNDPFVAHVLGVLAVRDSAAPLPALLSDVTMSG